MEKTETPQAEKKQLTTTEILDNIVSMRQVEDSISLIDNVYESHLGWLDAEGGSSTNSNWATYNLIGQLKDLLRQAEKEYLQRR